MNDEANRLQFEFSVFAKPLHEQVGLPAEKVKGYQKALDGIMGGRIMGLISDSEYDRILRRLVKKLAEMKRDSLKGEI